jgi:phytoene dehydrogenase-like protein
VKTVVIIGAGHNGLAAAFYLARAGYKTIVFERQATVGGGAITSTLHPGFRCPTLSHHTAVWEEVAREMDLARHGLEVITPPVDVFAPTPDGGGIVLNHDPRRSADSIRPLSAKDAEAYPKFREAISKVADVLASLLAAPPPGIDEPSPSDLWNLFATGRKFRALGRQDAFRLLRWGPMPVADLVDEWFECDLLRAAIAAPGLSGTMLAPRSAGSALVLLLREAHRLRAQGMTRVKGGPGALTAKMAAAATAAGAEVRTGIAVEQILAKDGRVTGVVAGGTRVEASVVLSAADPKTTFLTLTDPVDLSPEFLLKIRNYRSKGTIAKINLALSGLPAFSAPAGSTRKLTDILSGRIHIGARLDDLERAFDHAKYGELPQVPWLDITIPSILDPDLAPRGGHVMSIYVHHVPYALKDRDWSSAKEALMTAVMRVLEPYAPGVWRLVVGSQVLAPPDLESIHGFAGGHPFHGELALDQLFAMRPLLGYGRYDTPLEGLYLCSAGTHPGGFMAGASGRLAAREIQARS